MPSNDSITVREGIISLGSSDIATETMPALSVDESGHLRLRGDGVLQVGDKLGHFTIDDYIGGGGMGKVYLATDTALDRKVAIKTLPRQRIGNQGTVARFMNEAKSAARLNHEHIAQVYFAGEEENLPYIAFEYVEGTNVKQLTEEHEGLLLPLALNYIVQVAHALVHAAEHGVVHRDVKPSNILITKLTGKVKLIDMGLARLLDPAGENPELTASGVTLGTFDYISPEQARDPRNADIRSDIYSLGCTFFYMLAGRPPFPEGTVLQKLLQHQGDAPPDVRAFQPNVPPEIAGIIQRMMAKEPVQRYQTPTELIDALLVAARNIGLQTTGGGNIIWLPPPSNRRRFVQRHLPWIITVSLLLLGFIFVTLFSEQTAPLSLPNLPDMQSNLDALSSDTLKLPPTTSELFVEKSTLNNSSNRDFKVRLSPTKTKKHTANYGFPHIGFQLKPVWSPTRPLKQVSHRLSVLDIPVYPNPVLPASDASVFSFRVVDPSGETINSFSTLSAALQDAPPNTRFYLHWNGMLRITEPIVINKQNYTFIADEGCSPILEFEPNDSQQIRNFLSFFSVTGSRLEFKNIGLTLRINPKVLAPNWSLFDLSAGTDLTLTQCCLTVQNALSRDYTPFHDNVALFRYEKPANMGEDVSKGTETLAIQIANSLLRGETAGLQAGLSQKINLTIQDSFIALSKPLVVPSENSSIQKNLLNVVEFYPYADDAGSDNLLRSAVPSLVSNFLKKPLFKYTPADFSLPDKKREAAPKFDWFPDAWKVP